MRRREPAVHRLGLAALACVAILALSPVTALAQKGGKGGGGGNGGGSDNGDGSGTSIQYQIIRLDTGDDQLEGSAADINDFRFVVGSVNVFVDSLERVKAACWSVTEVDGSLGSSMAMLDDGGFFDESTTALSCNDAGEIVGSAGTVHASYWSDSDAELVLLPSPYSLSEAQDINNDGVACGFASSAGEYVASAWYFFGGQWQHVALPHMGDPFQDEEGNPLPDQSFALAISDLDELGVWTIVGQSNGNAVLWTATLNANGHVVAGPAFILAPDSVATGVNNAGAVCGYGGLGTSVGLVWIDGGMGEPLEPTYSSFTGNPRAAWPRDISHDGLIVGSDSFLAIYWASKDAAPVRLDDFLPKGKRSPFSSLARATAVNRWNEIVGSGSGPGDSSTSFPFLAIPK